MEQKIPESPSKKLSASAFEAQGIRLVKGVDAPTLAHLVHK